MKIYIQAEITNDGFLVIKVPIRPILKPRKLALKEAANFTAAEKAVLERVVQRKSNKEIANELNRVERTIKFHVSSILKKTGLNSRIDLAVFYGGGRDGAGGSEVVQ